jgi:putative peptide zinc metalloprotease protein
MTWLTLYAVAAFIYRIFLSISILLFVADKLFFLGALMAVSGLIGWVVVPCGKFVHYLLVHPELLKTRSRAVTVTAATLTVACVLLGIIPLPDHGRAEGVVEARTMRTVHAGVDSEVRLVRDSGTLVQGLHDVLLSAENIELRSQHEQLQAQLTALRHRYNQALAPAKGDAATAQSLRQQIDAVSQQLARIERDLEQLVIPAAFDGVWIAQDDQLVPGAYVQRGQALGQLVDVSDLYVRATADQYLGPRLHHELPPRAAVELRGRRQPDVHVTGFVRQIVAGGRRELPSAALGMAGGGNMAVETERQSTGLEAAEPFFEVDVELNDTQTSRLLPGQRVVVRFDLPWSPLGVQLWRAVRQTLQQRFQI